MPKGLFLLIIGLFFGTGLGFLLAASSGAQLSGHDHGGGAVHDHAAHDHDGMHDQLVEAGADVALSLTLLPDGPQSRNLHMQTTNFSFAPEAVNGAHVPGQGHAHIYVDGVKVARVYSPWVHLQALPRGDHTLRVTLNANDHRPLAMDGAPVEATLELSIE